MSILRFAILLLFLPFIAAPTPTGPGQNAISLNPPLAQIPGTYNYGNQRMVQGQSLSMQFWYEAHATSCTLNSTCGTAPANVNDAGKVLVATANGVTFTLPSPGAVGIGSFNFGYDGTHGYSLTASNGTAVFYGCGPSGTTISIAYDASVITDGTNYKCSPRGNASTNIPNQWGAQNTQSLITLTDGANVAVNAQSTGMFIWPLGANGHTAACPTGLISGQQQVLAFLINYSGAFTPSFNNTCYAWVNSTTPTWTAQTGTQDKVVCASWGSTTIVLCDFAPNYGFPMAIVANAKSPTNCASGTTCQTSSIVLTAGNILVIADSFYIGGSAGVTVTGGAITGTGSIGTCTKFTGAGGQDAGSSRRLDVQWCPITGSGTATVSPTFSGTAAFIDDLAVVISGAASSPDDGIGNFGSASAVTTLSVSPTGATTLADLVLGFAWSSCNCITAFTPPTNAFAGPTVTIAAPYESVASGTTPAFSLTASGSGTLDMAVVGIKP